MAPVAVLYVLFLLSSAKHGLCNNVAITSAIRDTIARELDMEGISLSDLDVQHLNSVDYSRQMLQQYHRAVRESTEPPVTDTTSTPVKRFHHFTSDVRRTTKALDHIKVHFAMNSSSWYKINSNTKVHDATMRIYKSWVKPDRLRDKTVVDKFIRVDIYRILSDNKRTLVTSRLVSLEGPGWEVFNIKDAVQHWVKQPSENYGLQIQSTSQNMHEVVGFEIRAKQLKPRLSVLTKSGHTPRSKTLSSAVCGAWPSQHRRCCRQPVKISFKDFGLDWIIKPQSFHTYMCRGNCPHSYRPAHLTSRVKSLIHAISPNRGHKPCCTATSFKKLVVLHYNQKGEQVVSQIDDLIAGGCMCS